MNPKIKKCQSCYYDNNCYWQDLAAHIPTDCNDYLVKEHLLQSL